jgi:hypothetical protein
MKSKEFLINEGLDYLFDFNKIEKSNSNEFDSVNGVLEEPFPIQYDDLARLYKLIRTRKPFTVLEFGIGFSTAVIAHALKKNLEEWEKLDSKPKIRNRFMFKCFSVDTSEKWIKHTKTLLSKEIVDIVQFSHSNVSIGKFNGQLCHYYDLLPDVVPDFIYLDGPHPKEVKGNINGLSFQCDERTVMGADILLMEAILIPGTFILVDGRTNNVRFLKNNFKRNFEFNWDSINDISTFELKEEKLGPFNIQGHEVY